LYYEFDKHGSKPVDFFFYSAKILVSTMIELVFYHVFHELLSFRGSELHFISAENFAEKILGEVQAFIDDCIIVGLERHQNSYMLPGPHWVIEKDDSFIILAETKIKAVKALSKAHSFKQTRVSHLSTVKMERSEYGEYSK